MAVAAGLAAAVVVLPAREGLGPLGLRLIDIMEEEAYRLLLLLTASLLLKGTVHCRLKDPLRGLEGRLVPEGLLF